MFSDRVNKHYDLLNKTDLYIIKIIMDHLSKIDKMGVEELAQKCNTSRTSILRVAKKLDFSGYSELKNYLKWENEKYGQPKLANLTQTMKQDFDMTYAQIENAKQLDAIVDKVRAAKQVFIYGTGQAQRYCAQELQRLFMQIGKHMYVINASEEFILVTKKLTPNDLVIILSLSGELRHIKPSVALLNMNNVPIVSITNLGNNELASMADFRLYAVSSPLPIAADLVHHSFANFFVIIEYLFRVYLEKNDVLEYPY